MGLSITFDIELFTELADEFVAMLDILPVHLRGEPVKFYSRMELRESLASAAPFSLPRFALASV